MSVSCSDSFSDLLCGEDSGTIFSRGDLPECSSDLESATETEESIASFMVEERKYLPGIDYIERFQSQSLDASARAESVAWIVKVQRYYGFQPLTAYLSVNYLDRFLYSHWLPESKNGWPMQLLSVACLSLAAKMEEPLVPSVLDLQVGAKYIFEPRTLLRMELLLLSVLDWRLRSVTPFSFISFFAYKLDSTGTYTGFLISRATEIILSNIQEASFLEYWPSCIAATTILCAANDIPNLSMLVDAGHAESWCDGLTKEKIISCYQMVQEIAGNNNKRPKVLPQFKVMARARILGSSDSSSSSSYNKRRRLNNSLWVDDDKENSE